MRIFFCALLTQAPPTTDITVRPAYAAVVNPVGAGFIIARLDDLLHLGLPRRRNYAIKVTYTYRLMNLVMCVCVTHRSQIKEVVSSRL